MRRKITTASSLVALCLAAGITWYVLTHTGGHAVVVVTEPVTPAKQASNDVPKTKPARVVVTQPTKPAKQEDDANRKFAQHVLALDTMMAHYGPDAYCPCYLDEQLNTLYLWKGVVLNDVQIKQTWYDGMPSGIKCVRPSEWTVVLFDAPIKYWQTADGFRPGYLDRTTWMFYAWQEVVLRQKELLDKSTDGKDAIVKPAFRSQEIGVIEIAMPTHLKTQPELWKKLPATETKP